MSTTGNRELAPAKLEAMAVRNDRGPDPLVDLHGFMAHGVQGAPAIGSPAYPQPELAICEQSLANFRLGYDPTEFLRQYAAVAASRDPRLKLAGLTASTVVIHGDADPLVPVEGGKDTAGHIPDAELRIIASMGDDFPPEFFAEIAEGILWAVE